jgi:hypothetical protein
MSAASCFSLSHAFTLLFCLSGQKGSVKKASLFHSFPLTLHNTHTLAGTSAAAKSGATNPSATAITSELFSFSFSFFFWRQGSNPSATAITSELFVSDANHEQNVSPFRFFILIFFPLTDCQLHRHLPADAEGMAFAKDFVPTPAPA